MTSHTRSLESAAVTIPGLDRPVGPLGWGMWRLRGTDVAQAHGLCEAALAAGMTLFDTADIYGPDNGEAFGASEALLGKVFAADPGLRQKVVLASKGGIIPPTPYDSSLAYLTAACEASLRRLNTDVLDLYQVHRPDHLAHPAEVAEAFDRLRQAGKIRAAGVSNFTPAQTAALVAHMPFPLSSIQPEFSALAIEGLSDGVLDQAMQHRLAVLAWSPLGQGRLAEPGTDTRAQRVVAVIDRVAAVHATSRTAVALAFVLTHPSRPIALVGSQNPERLHEAAAATTLRLSRQDWYDILVASRGMPMP